MNCAQVAQKQAFRKSFPIASLNRAYPRIAEFIVLGCLSLLNWEPYVWVFCTASSQAVSTSRAMFFLSFSNQNQNRTPSIGQRIVPFLKWKKLLVSSISLWRCLSPRILCKDFSCMECFPKPFSIVSEGTEACFSSERKQHKITTETKVVSLLPIIAESGRNIFLLY